jgi:hypothetical protein
MRMLSLARYVSADERGPLLSGKNIRNCGMVRNGSRTDDPLSSRNVRCSLLEQTFGLLPGSANVWSGRASQDDVGRLTNVRAASMYSASVWSYCSGPAWGPRASKTRYRKDLCGPSWQPVLWLRREDRSSISFFISQTSAGQPLIS